MASVRLADYRPAPCLIRDTTLTVQLYADRTLVEADLLSDQPNQVSHRFVATGDPDKFATLARRFLGPEVLTVSNKI